MTVCAQTGTVVGTVRDEAGIPLPGINVVLTGTTLGDATDLDGEYQIRQIPAGTYRIQASSIGFEAENRSITIAPGDVLTMDFVLREATLRGDEVVVTAARRAQRFSDVPVSIELVLPEELETRNILSLDEALRYVPGVQMADNQVNVRGSSGFTFNTGSRVLLLLDGLPLLRPDSEGVPHDALPIAQIERIEVVKGPGSALYGSGALGGVINIITKDYPRTPETTLQLYAGAYEPVRYEVWREQWEDADEPRRFGGGSFTHARQLGTKAGFWLNTSYREDEGFTNFRTERDLDAFLKFGWRPSTAFRFDMLSGWTFRKSDSFLYWNGARDALNPGELEFGGIQATGTNDNQTNLFSLMPSFTHVVSSAFFYAIKGRLIGIVIQPLEDDGTPKPVENGTTGIRYGGEIQANWQTHFGSYLTGGVTTEQLLTESSFFQPDTVDASARSQPERAAFLQVEQALTDRLNVVAGVRYDTYEIDTTEVERKLSPKLNVSYRFSEYLTLRAAYGEGFRVPSLGERFVNDRAFLPIVPNLDLRPEISTSYEVGVRSGVALPRGLRSQMDVALFWNDYRRLVEPTFVAEEQAFQFINLIKARIRGFEASLNAGTDNDAWLLSLSYTFLDADDRSENKPLIFRSRHLFKTSLTAPLIGPLSAGVDFRYASAPERVDNDFSRFVRDATLINARKVLDARLVATWKHVRLALLVKNALEYYYVERPAILAPPRHVTLQVRTQF